MSSSDIINQTCIVPLIVHSTRGQVEGLQVSTVKRLSKTKVSKDKTLKEKKPDFNDVRRLWLFASSIVDKRDNSFSNKEL